MPLELTLHKFRQLCFAVAQSYPTMTMAEYFSSNELPEKFALMSHDIDRKPESVLNTAGIEQEWG